jgi:hypothetical protein
MNDWQTTRLTDAELKAFFDRLFPLGFDGADLLAELAPEGWEKSPLLACFHPSPEQVFKEQLQVHRNLERLAESRRKRGPDTPKLPPRPEPTLEEVRADWKDEPVNVVDEVTELLGQCLWDVFSDNHDVIVPDGRIVDIGSFRGASAFLDEWMSGRSGATVCGDEHRFYMGTIWISQRADLAPVYRLIFRRVKALGGDWQYQFPRLHLVDLSPLRKALDQKKPEDYSPSESFAEEQAERERQAELEKSRAEWDEIYEQSRREAMDRPPPETVRAYQEVYGHDPKGWPPV